MGNLLFLTHFIFFKLSIVFLQNDNILIYLINSFWIVSHTANKNFSFDLQNILVVLLCQCIKIDIIFYL